MNKILKIVLCLSIISASTVSYADSNKTTLVENTSEKTTGIITSVVGTSSEVGQPFGTIYSLKIEPKHLFDNIDKVILRDNTLTPITEKSKLTETKFYKDTNNTIVLYNIYKNDKIEFKDTNDRSLGIFKKTDNGYEKIKTSETNNEVTTNGGVESEEQEDHDTVSNDTYLITSIKERSEDNYYYIIINPKEKISNIEEVHIDNVRCIETGSKGTVFADNTCHIDTENGYIYIPYKSNSEGRNITFKNKAGKIIGSFTKRNGKYEKVVKENTNQKDLKVKIEGSFEAAIVGQKKYDAISGATGSVSDNKNSNVKVYVQEVEKGQEADNSKWKLVKDTNIRLIKNNNGNKSQGIIDKEGSGMKVGYNPHESSLILQGVPDKAGDYKISINVVDNYGRTAQSNTLPFKIYDLSETTLENQLVIKNFKKFEHGDELKWDMEPWEINTFGGTDETITVPKELKVWFGSHESGTYGALGRAIVKKVIPRKQTLIIDEGTNLTISNMKILTSVDIIVKNGGKLNLDDSSLYGKVIVQNGGTLQVNYSEYEGKLKTGTSINGKIVLEEGATLENSSIYSNANSLTDGDEAKKIKEPVVEVTGNVNIKGKVFIRGDESPSGDDPDTHTEYKAQPALKVKDGNLNVSEGSILGVYGGGSGMFATTTNGGDALILDHGTISGNGVLVAVGGNGVGLSRESKGGDALSGEGNIDIKESYLFGGYSSVDNEANFGSPRNGNIVVSSNTTNKEEPGKKIGNTNPPQYWSGSTTTPGGGDENDPLKAINGLKIKTPEEELADAKNSKKKEIEKSTLTKEDKIGKTEESIKLAEEKLKDLRQKAEDELDKANTLAEVRAVKVDKEKAINLLKDVAPINSLEEARKTKLEEIENLKLTEEEKAGKTSESIEKAETKLIEIKKKSKESLEKAETLAEVEAVKVDKQEALALLKTTGGSGQVITPNTGESTKPSVHNTTGINAGTTINNSTQKTDKSEDKETKAKDIKLIKVKLAELKIKVYGLKWVAEVSPTIVKNHQKAYDETMLSAEKAMKKAKAYLDKYDTEKESDKAIINEQNRIIIEKLEELKTKVYGLKWVAEVSPTIVKKHQKAYDETMLSAEKAIKDAENYLEKH